MATEPLDRQTVLDLDPWLEPQVPAILHRHELFRKWKDTIQSAEGGYDAFSQGYKTMGLNIKPDNSVVYREWAPNAKEAVLTGDFSKSGLPRRCTDAERAVQTSGTAFPTR